MIPSAETAQNWGIQLGVLSIQITILITLAYGAAYLFRRVPARYRYILWVLVFIRLAIPWPLAFPWGIGHFPARLFASAFQGQGAAGGREGAGLTAAGISLGKIVPADWAAVWFWIWVSGFVIICSVCAARLIQCRRKVRALQHLSRPDLLALIQQWSTYLGLKRRIQLLKAGDADAVFPSVHGFVSPCIILPSEMACRWTAEELEPVLVHELTHIRRKDGLVNLLQIAVQAFYFYHPLVWLANRSMRRERELACDDAVVHRYGGSPTEYVRSMIHAAEAVVCPQRQPLWGIPMAETYSNVGERIRRMLRRDYGAQERFGRACLFAVIVLAVFIAGASSSPWSVTEAIAAPEKIYTVGEGVQAPLILAQTLPPYSDEAKRAKVEGVVLLQGVIRKDGSVGNLRVVRGLGSGLDESALNTIKNKWRFKPGTHEGVPVDVYARIEVSFRLY